ncbi:Mss4-like protein [Irpex rosettiformis]|uniref:Mss4-like protein n=1 Tax=Irpex rosettiformis TaxID=378272 RepID=A0ACB8UAU0_9APHY|nr:Mss4-like protein [Irpex rosettiformis]
MSGNEQSVKVNVHLEAPVHKREHSGIPHPPLEDHQPNRFKPVPDTGWKGTLPSQQGGDEEPDFLSKPPYTWKSEDDKFVPKYTAQCWCGNVSFQFHGDPVDAKHCHCHQCQALHGAPFQWAVIFPKTSVRLIKNENDSLHFFSTEKKRGVHYVPCKVSCDQCRSPLFDEGRNTVLAYPGSFKFKDHKVPQDFQPTAHIFYSQRLMDVSDGIPKWSGHKGQSELLQEMTPEEGTMPKV